VIHHVVHFGVNRAARARGLLRRRSGQRERNVDQRQHLAKHLMLDASGEVWDCKFAESRVMVVQFETSGRIVCQTGTAIDNSFTLEGLKG